MTGISAAATAELDAVLGRFVAQDGLPGAAAGVVHDNELAWTAGAGSADPAGQAACGPETLYRIASITKTFTGTAILQLRDAGQLDLDDPAVTYLPELRRAASPFAAIETVTIRRMLSHESGLAAEPPGTDWAVAAYQGDPRQTLARPEDIAVALPPNAQHKYSDLAYQLLGEIVTRVTGTSYPQYIRKMILDPLGMTATGFDPLAETLAGHRAAGYTRQPYSDELDPEPPFPPVWAEGGLWSCVHDLARWLAFQLRAHTPAPDSPVLAAATLREMHKPRYLADDDWTTAWGISWSASRHDNTTWIQHSGGLPGYTTTICFNPAAQIGAIVLHNGANSTTDTARDLAVTACRHLTPPGPPVAATPAPAGYQPLLGLYTRAGLGGGIISLHWQAGRLTFRIPEIPAFKLTLEPTSTPDTFTAGSGTDLAGETITFHRHPAGHIISVHLVQATYQRLDHPGTALREPTATPADPPGK